MREASRAGLRAADAQGCEDLLFYCRVAERHRFAVVPDYLIGYRYLSDNMSSNLPRMLRSWMLVMGEMEERHPGRRALLEAGLRNYSAWLLFKALTIGRRDYFFAVLRLLARRNPGIALTALGWELPRSLIEALRRRLRWALRRRRRSPDLIVTFPIEEPRQCA